MKAFLLIIFVVTLCGDVTFGVAVTDANVLASPGSEFKGLTLQSDLVLLGISMIATAVTGFGAAMLNKTERLLALMEGASVPAIAAIPAKGVWRIERRNRGLDRVTVAMTAGKSSRR